MVPSRVMEVQTKILCIAGPTASGKSSRAIEEALKRGGEVISVDSRQIYRGLDIGTEKITVEEARGVPHHLIDIRDPQHTYSAGEFVTDATRLIDEISSRGHLPILVGGTHFYFDALLKGLPAETDADPILREALEKCSTEELYTQVLTCDPQRAQALDPHNRRRLVRALEIIKQHGHVPKRTLAAMPYAVEWIVIDLPTDELRTRLDTRLKSAIARGLIAEVRHVREQVGDARLNELGLEYKIVGEFIRGERNEASLLPTLTAKLWQYAKRQKAWLRKLQQERVIVEAV